MQETIDNVIAEISRFVAKPPSRPIRLMFFDTQQLYEVVQNRVKDEFMVNEIINIDSFFNSDKWLEASEEFQEIENKYGLESNRFQKKLCEVLENYIITFIGNNSAKKLLIIEDSDLYNNGFDPIHFLSAYMYENYIVLEKEIPVIWLTIGKKDKYSTNEYNYYKTDTTNGRIIKIAQENFRSCILNYELSY